VIPAHFRYLRAGSVEEALTALSDPDAVALAGGQSLLPLMKLRLARPGLVCDLGRLPLDGIETADEEIRIGALATWDSIARSEEIRRIPALVECAAGVADLQVRNRGTIGGGCCHADPAADMPCVLLALGARFRLRSGSGERTVAATDFFLGPYATAAEHGELLTAVHVPVPPPGSGSAYVSVEHPASGYALAGAAVSVSDEGRSLAITGLGGRPLAVESPEAVAELDAFGDGYASADYRREVVRVVLERALRLAQERRGR
jgi:aerobic carbon-monoxide dehydrogenase medium subunit